MPTPAQLLSRINDVIVEHVGLVVSPVILDVRLNANQLIDECFSTAITSSNGPERGRERYRLSHTVVISFVDMVIVDEQALTQVNALEKEDRILQAMSTQSNFPAYSVVYKSTSRQLSSGREYHISNMTFEISHYHELI